MSKPVWIAHRGVEDAYPENTAIAFEAALKAGMGVEFDLKSTSDGELVVMHDDTVDRTTDGSGRVMQLSLAEIRELDAGSWKGSEFAGARVPTFAEAVEQIASFDEPATAIALDIRSLQPGMIRVICDVLSAHNMLHRTVGIGIIWQSVDVRRRFYEGSADFQCSNIAQTPDALPGALTDPYSNWIYGRFVPSVADVETVHAAGKKLLASGDAISGSAVHARTAFEAGADAVLTWQPSEFLG